MDGQQQNNNNNNNNNGKKCSLCPNGSRVPSSHSNATIELLELQQQLLLTTDNNNTTTLQTLDKHMLNATDNAALDASSSYATA
eukprot:CAMPEP_0118710302 /NCGR_PEP_ID=MMETSP0800-20121206/23271_1 /TAXON_ID=210618 ORGANISM="Striatella unipunctata, Strain CCMP2910" /NCGR_SAMPLE_ID=MMETSP0800 /ASSEMBLY_ACC=CAM_ASM_000638 /LENGTH=83 /DNA_ID=CAMNT_0006614399 /DNA_START=272 /DNA_END=519 /DNA_ORIENTATION=+